MHHLLFCCANAKVIWATFAICLGDNDIPASPEQCWSWCKKWIPNGKSSLELGLLLSGGLSGIIGTRFALKAKSAKSTLEIIFHVCALMCSWAGLFSEDEKKMLIKGVNAMLKIEIKLLSKPQDAAVRTNFIQDAGRDGDADPAPSI